MYFLFVSSIPLPDVLNDVGYENQSIEVRGFLYRNPEGNYILAEMPNLRSCCLKKQEKFLFVEGDFSQDLPKQAVDVSGVLQKGVLKEAKLIPSEKLNGSFLLGGGVFLLGVIYCLKKSLFKKTSGSSLPKK